MTTGLLDLSGITKSYGSRRVLDDITFSVSPGRLTGFVGGNGAGKTTTMRIVLGVLDADGGSVSLDGARVTTADRRRFGYMPEERGLYPKMKVLEQVVYLARLHGFGRAEATERATGLLTELGLGERLDDKIESLSLGNQQRAQIAAALVHEPEVLILDEPFSGLDPLAVDVVAGVLQARAAQGASIIFSSHQLDVVERLCDDLIIIAGGTIRAAGSRDAMRAEHSTLRYELSGSTDAGWVRDEAGVEVIDFEGGTAVFDADSPETAQRILRSALDRGEVTTFAPQHPSLAQIFKEVIQ
ncbi:ATP-binding cassette domain-containing protein [Microbacterium pseudoresistens]|uniref:ABC-2 type transport system ATP-binding protein n=1 Tax=Microbacterium pseudoresistens TaxID=640634 RepID=A0A7Y9JMQ6_9MICO|nr:ATP-binding cassette domain-containing protein [Microbacterium pseudoresistens]NYD54276.1 ABC-2 type transport system ATP-binding protein [Microbacterium pseudoresistens]